MSKETTEAKNLGVALACALRGISPSELSKCAGYVEHCDNNPGTAKILVKAASLLFRVDAMMTGDATSPYEQLYLNLEKKSSISPVLIEKFVTPVMDTFSAYAYREKDEDMRKEAANLLTGSLITSTAGRALGSVPAALKTLLAASALGGGAVGSLAWLLNKDSTEDDAVIEAKRMQTKHFNSLTKDLKSRLRAKGVSLEDEKKESSPYIR